MLEGRLRGTAGGYSLVPGQLPGADCRHDAPLTQYSSLVPRNGRRARRALCTPSAYIERNALAERTGHLGVTALIQSAEQAFRNEKPKASETTVNCDRVFPGIIE